MNDDYDELNKRLRAEREEQAREFNKKDMAYHTLMGEQFEPPASITFDPSYFTKRLKENEVIGKEEGFQAAMEEQAALANGVDPAIAELTKLRLWLPFIEAKIKDMETIRFNYVKQKNELTALLDTVHSALEVASMNETNYVSHIKQRMAELEAIVANHPE